MSRADTWAARMAEDAKLVEVVFVPNDGRPEQLWKPVGPNGEARRFCEQVQLAWGVGALERRPVAA